MSYVIKNGDRYVDINGQYRSGVENARRYDTLAEATLSVQAAKIFGEHVVDTNAPDAMTTLRDQVAEFHAMIGEPAPTVPEVPIDDAVRLRLSLVSEEFYEVASEFMPALHTKHYFESFQNTIRNFTRNAWQNTISLPKLVKELADLQYVIEGTFQRLGIDSGPILAEVHRSNMAKRGAGKDENGKWRKPAGWTPPDIAGELRKQGWRVGK